MPEDESQASGGWGIKLVKNPKDEELVEAWRAKNPKINNSKDVGIMQREHVVSSNIESIGYENSTLEIRFLSGGTYQYFAVPQHVYDELMAAESKGKYFASRIKDHYKFSKA